MSAYVLDASVAAKWFVDEEYSANAHKVAGSGDELHVPNFFFLEMDNVICKWLRRGKVSEAEGEAARVSLAGASIEGYSTENLRDSAFSIAVQTGCTVYDCLYVSLAMFLNAPVVTADRRLYESLAKGPFAQHIVWVGDIA